MDHFNRFRKTLNKVQYWNVKKREKYKVLPPLLSQPPFYSQPVANRFSIKVIKIMSFPCTEPFNCFLSHLAKSSRFLLWPKRPCRMAKRNRSAFPTVLDMLISSHLRTFALRSLCLECSFLYLHDLLRSLLKCYICLKRPYINNYPPPSLKSFASCSFYFSEEKQHLLLPYILLYVYLLPLSFSL